MEITTGGELLGYPDEQMHYVFLYQDETLEELWSEDEIIMGTFIGIGNYQAWGGTYDPARNRNWSFFISTPDNNLDPLWTDVCRNSPVGCTCANGGLFPAQRSEDENQIGLSGYYLSRDPAEGGGWIGAQMRVACHETLHILRWQEFGDMDREHTDTEFWTMCF